MAIHITSLNGGDITVGSGSTPAVPTDPTEGGFWTISYPGKGEVKCSKTSDMHWEGSSGGNSGTVEFQDFGADSVWVAKFDDGLEEFMLPSNDGEPTSTSFSVDRGGTIVTVTWSAT